MRRIAVLAIMLGLAAPAAATPRVPRIWLSDMDPVTVAARGFQAQERVKVTVSDSGTRWAKSVVSTPAGAFTARFRISLSPRCNGGMIVVTAAGSQGSRATWKFMPVEECPPPIDPGK